MSEFNTTRRVEFRDTDAAGIVHFSVFFAYMEQAEHEFLRSIGLSVVEVVDGKQISWPRVHAQCDYRTAIKFEDVIDIIVAIDRIGEKSVTYLHRFERDGTLVAEGKLTVVCCELNHGSPPESIRIPEMIIDKLRPFKKLGGMSTYLAELMVKLAAGIGKMPESRRTLHSNFFKSRQREDGGFAGREGESDLYYAGFALRALSILGELHGEPAERAAKFVVGKMAGQESIIDFFSLIYSASLLQVSAGINVLDDNTGAGWQDQVGSLLQKLRRPDGGFAKAIEGQASSTYQTFLVVLCLQLIDRPIPEPLSIVRFLHSQKNKEGGFREIRASKRAGTNPTAAAIATLKILEALDEETIQDNIDFLCEMQSSEGGVQANTRIPFADLLSTFTGLLTLDDMLAAEELDLASLHAFTNKLQHAEGGFRAGNFDEAVDVEYSFYGLGTLALIAHYGFV